jgi:signal transduction histidine kinase
MLLSLYLPAVLLVAVGGTGMALYAWLNRDTAGGGPLSLFLLSASLLSLAEALSLATPGIATKYWATIGYAIAGIVPLAWLLAVFEYTGYDRNLSRWTAPLLLVEPVVYSALLWTNDSHHLVWGPDWNIVVVDGYTAFVATESLAFWGHLVYVYVLVAAGAWLLVTVSARAERLFQTQASALLAAIAVPLVVSTLAAYGLLPTDLDPTGPAFVVSGAVLVGAIYQDRLLSVSPAARELGREALVAELDDQVFIVDDTDTLVDCNPAAERLLPGDRSTAVGNRLPIPDLAAVVAEGPGQYEITLEDGHVTRYYDVRVSAFDRAYGTVSGSIVALRDVTDRTRREQRLDVMNRLFRHNLRNEMNVVRGNAELLADDLSGPARDRAHRIIDTVDEVIDRSDKIGALSQSLDGDEENRPVDIAFVLDAVVEQVRHDYSAADVQTSVGERSSWLVDVDASIEVALTELLVNAIEHADGPDPTVSVALSAARDGVELTVSDDGPGLPEQELSVIEAGVETPLEHGSGIGLWMVTWLVERAGGRIDFAVDDGTTVTVWLPAA